MIDATPSLKTQNRGRAATNALLIGRVEFALLVVLLLVVLIFAI